MRILFYDDEHALNVSEAASLAYDKEEGELYFVESETSGIYYMEIDENRANSVIHEAYEKGMVDVTSLGEFLFEDSDDDDDDDVF